MDGRDIEFVIELKSCLTYNPLRIPLSHDTSTVKDLE